MFSIELAAITGVMVGFEFAYLHSEETGYLVIDLFIIRILISKNHA
jgi:hypothetical protein